jgi:hypothetical protein
MNMEEIKKLSDEELFKRSLELGLIPISSTSRFNMEKKLRNKINGISEMKSDDINIKNDTKFDFSLAIILQTKFSTSKFIILN